MRRRLVVALVPLALAVVACGDPGAPSASGSAPPAAAAAPTATVRPTGTTLALIPTTVPTGHADASAAATTLGPAPIGSAATTSVWPATSLLVVEGPAADAIERLGPIALTEPCPEPDHDVTPTGPLGDEMAKLEPMLGAVVRYGGERPDEFGGYGLVWHAPTDASVVLAMTGDPVVHRAAVATLVDHPDELIVCQAAVSEQQAAGVRAALEDDAGGARLTSVSSSWGIIDIGLAATEEDYAGELLERYGDAVRLTVGALPYPDRGAASQCGPPRVAARPGLDVTLPPPAAMERAANGISFTATITNTSSGPIEVAGGSTLAATLLDASGRPVSSLAGIAFTADLVTDVLQPGDSAERRVLVGIASCDPALGYAVPPGTYDVVVGLDRSDGGSSTSAVPFELT